MSKKKKNRPVSSGIREDVVISREETGERKIKTVDEVHTVEAPDAVYIPAETEEAPAEVPGEKTRRFIRTSDAPHVSVREDAAAKETETAVSKYTDRFVTPENEEQVHTGFTGKMGTYDQTHAVKESDGRMIDVSLFQMRFDLANEAAAEPAAEPAETEEGGTKPIGKGDLLREIAGTADEDVRRNPDQMMMEGFDVIGMKTAEEVRSEEELKEELDRTREKKIGDFRFWNKKDDGELGQTDDVKFEKTPVSRALPQALDRFSRRFSHLETPFTPVKTEEYTDHNNRREGFSAIRRAKTFTLLRAGALALLGLVLLILDAVAAGNVSNNGGRLTLFGGSNAALAVINLAFGVLGAAALFPELKNAVFSILKLHPRTDAVLLGLALTTLLQNAFAIRTELQAQADFRLLTPAFLLLAAPYLLSKVFYYDSEHHCFKIVSTKSDKSYLRQVTEPVLAARLNHTDNPDKKAVYVGKTRFVDNFFYRWANAQKAGEPFGRVVAIGFILTAVTAVVAWIVGKDFLYAVSAAALCLSFSVPLCSLLSTGFYLTRQNKALSLKSSFIGSCADAAAFTKLENIAADAADLFDGSVVSCLTSKDVTERQVRFVAAAIAKGAGGLTKKLFAADIETYDDKIPPCESLVYEEKLGLSAWVSGCKVLLGTHDLMTNHSVEVPDESVVLKVLGEGEKPLYLAIEGRFTAVFAVKYSCKESVRKGVGRLVENGTVLTLSTTDANISDTFAETLLGLPAESVGIMSSAASEGVTAAAAVVTDREELGAAFGEGFTGLCRVADSALTLDKVCRGSKMVCTAGAFVSLILGMILVFTGAYKSIGAWSVLLMQALLTGICFATPFIGNGKFDLEKARNPFAKWLTKKEAEPAPESEEDAVQPEAEITAENGTEPAETEAPEETGAAEPETKPADADETLETRTGFRAADEKPAFEIPDPDLIPDEIPETDGTETDATDDNAFSRFMKKEDRKPRARKKEKKGGLIVSETMQKTFSGIGSFLGEISDSEKREEIPDDGGFTLYGDKTARRRQSAEEIEKDYEELKKEEKALASRFTAPKAPDAPIFDLSRSADEPDEAPEDAGFTAPEENGGVDLFDEDLWSRFEDDKVFAGLHEDEDDNDSLFDF